MTSTTTDSIGDEQRRHIAIIPLGSQYSSTDARALRYVEEWLSDEIDKYCGGVVIDLRQTRYVGCGFLNVLLRCYEKAKQRDIRFTFSGLNSFPNSVLAVTRLHSLWDILPTRQAAIDAIDGNEKVNTPLSRRSDELPSDGS